MCPHARICLLLLVGVLVSPSAGGTIGNKDGRIYFKSVDDTNESGEELTVNYPLWKTSAEGSRRQNVQIGSLEVSRFTLEQGSGSTPQPPVYISSEVAQQAGTSELPMKVKPLLDEDELVAFEVNKLKTTLPPSTGALPTNPVTVLASQQPAGGDMVVPSQLEDILKSIFDAAAVRGESTTQRPRQPPRIDVTSQKPPVGSTENTSEFQEFLPQIEEVLKSVLVKDKPEGSQPPITPYPPPPQQPKLPVANAEEDFKHILPALEEAIGSIFKNSEPNVPTMSRRPTVHPTTTTDNKQHFAAVLPQLEDAIRSILDEAVREEEEKAQQHATQRPLPTQQPSAQTTKDNGFGNFLPKLEQVFGDIMYNQDPHHSATFPNGADPTSTVRMPIQPITATTSEQPHFLINVIVPDSPSSDSGPLFQAVKSTLEDVLNQQELKARKSQTGP